MLQLSDLKKRYDTGDYALKGVTLDVPQGQVLALIGPSGCLLYTSDAADE